LGHPLWAQKLYSVVSVPLGVNLKTVPPPLGTEELVLAPPYAVVLQRSPLVACTSGRLPANCWLGALPFVPSKLKSMVKVCAGSAIAVAAHSAKTAHARVPRFSLPNVAANSSACGVPR